MIACDHVWLDRFEVPPHVPAGAIAISGIYDLRDLSKATTLIGRPVLMPLVSTDAEMRRRMSPILFVHSGAPPFLFLDGGDDRIIQRDRTMELVAALQQTGTPVSAYRIPGRNHVTIVSNMPEPFDVAGELVLQFVRQISETVN
jgi:acetyl esterase/lipase